MSSQDVSNARLVIHRSLLIPTLTLTSQKKHKNCVDVVELIALRSNYGTIHRNKEQTSTRRNSSIGHMEMMDVCKYNDTSISQK